MTTAPDIHSPVNPISGATPDPAPTRSIMISREGEEALRRALAELLDEREHQLPRRVQRAHEFGEAVQNDDYLQIAEEEAVNSARIRNLRAILASARVIDPGDGNDGVAGLGSIVTLGMAGKQIERRLLGAHEPTGSDGFSVASPIGRAILDTRPGETVVAELPDGRSIEIEVVAVRCDRERQTLAAA